MNFLPTNKNRLYVDLFLAGAIISLAVIGYLTGKATEVAENLTSQTASVTNQVSNNVIIKTNLGEIVIELYPDKAPDTVSNFVKLANTGFYNGTKFHRVIPDFMIQGGDPLSKDDSLMNRWGTGGPGYTFSDENNDVVLERGVLAMANSGPNTNGSQFFIITALQTPWLQGKHTAFGRVVRGMEVVDAISAVQRDQNDRPISNVVLNSVDIN